MTPLTVMGSIVGTLILGALPDRELNHQGAYLNLRSVAPQSSITKNPSVSR